MWRILATVALLFNVSGEDVGLFYTVNPQIPPSEVSSEPHPGVRECNKYQLEYCESQLAIHLGIDKDLFKKPVELVREVEKIIFHNGNTGILNVCKARTDFHTCLGSDYAACTDLFNILKFQGLTGRDAFILADFYDNMDFDCNGGFLQGIRHWSCIEKTHLSDNYKKHTEECFKQYNETVHKNPHLYCQAAESFSFCQAMVYASDEDCQGRELLWWECERTLRRAQLDGYCSRSSCAKVFEELRGIKSQAQPVEKKFTLSTLHRKLLADADRKHKEMLN
ncbi:unnamed protein product [Bursaphelenchus okinawaensis]|uniref:DUF19 domain-containing protein n=1 Tax=Bursaphelenchus okinawaensis TaxID=465554 RepID=A0A811KW77_9BILA|nr:unnamed protein product [Bursaphelenchus okinawaensis]CAG9112346.1 unnamed protein product [Bursaphelenchus okinawaensis]